MRSSIAMKANQMMWVPKGCESINCLEGLLWVTCENSSDIIMRSNSSLNVQSCKKTLIQSIGSVRLSFSS